MRTTCAFVTLITLAASLVFAHPGEEHKHVSPNEHARRAAESAARHLKARKCSSAISQFETRRMMKRESVFKRQAASSTASAQQPTYTTIQNSTCVTAPEVTEGPYYINNEYVRTDLSETQSGLKLILDIGVIDTTTCEPLSNVFVELWNANATGVYGGYRAGTGGGPGGPPGSSSGSGNTSLIHTETFLRGGYFTNDNGIVEITTIYPGYYTGRTAHIHTMIHKDWKQASNGTLISAAGSLLHIGQFFFDETWNNEIFATAPYNTTDQQRTLNSEDSILDQENSDGNNAFVNLQELGSSLDGGLLGYITVGVDSTKAYNITNTNSL